ncbi:AIR synthase-related protein [Dethiosulfovibrio sp. F2B]|uniref:AIR synthase-related protein n=1 Tax=Dethiosulfovibrio faecalis TaxID=2720018 RepID=UPI001F29939F|nr:AIR synthase-related protein [Dethiosulfovibrio faecalis]MCF4152277.1 AIR synthase-related protein [Dethiosulfovibrio faecalis]
MSKFSRSTMERSVYGPLSRQAGDPSVLLGSLFGEDIALVDTGSGLVASHVDPIVGASEGLGRLAVHVACNDIAAGGIRPRWAQLLVLVPDEGDEDILKDIMEDAVKAAQEISVTIVGGHSGYTSALSRPLAAVTAFGSAEPGRMVSTGGASEGDVVCVTRGVGLEGTAILAWDYPEECRSKGLSEGDIAEARSLADRLSVVEEALKLASLGATAMHDPTRGGVLEAMCEMAQGAGMSFRIDGDALPISETVDRFSRAFDFDPMRMISSGALVVTLPGEAVERAGAELESIAPLYPVGVVEKGSGVTITSSSGDRFYEDPEPDFDELARLQAYISCEKRQKLVH